MTFVTVACEWRKHRLRLQSKAFQPFVTAASVLRDSRKSNLRLSASRCLRCSQPQTLQTVLATVANGFGVRHNQRMRSLQQPSLEDRKYGFVWIFPHHSCENIQTYFEFLDTFGYSPIISEQLSDVWGGQSPP